MGSFFKFILPDTLEVREDSLFEVYEHFYGNVTVCLEKLIYFRGLVKEFEYS